MADGSGLSTARIQFFNLIPEATRASCSIWGFWGDATPNGGLVHGRALDWDDEAPISQYPMITVYNFSTNGSIEFANFGWVGIVGSLAGMSPLVGIGERLWSDKGEVSEYGTPWMYNLRDVL